MYRTLRHAEGIARTWPRCRAGVDSLNENAFSNKPES